MLSWSLRVTGDNFIISRWSDGSSGKVESCSTPHLTPACPRATNKLEIGDWSKTACHYEYYKVDLTLPSYHTPYQHSKIEIININSKLNADNISWYPIQNPSVQNRFIMGPNIQKCLPSCLNLLSVVRSSLQWGFHLQPFPVWFPLFTQNIWWLQYFTNIPSTFKSQNCFRKQDKQVKDGAGLSGKEVKSGVK